MINIAADIFFASVLIFSCWAIYDTVASNWEKIKEVMKQGDKL